MAPSCQLINVCVFTSSKNKWYLNAKYHYHCLNCSGQWSRVSSLYLPIWSEKSLSHKTAKTRNVIFHVFKANRNGCVQQLSELNESIHKQQISRTDMINCTRLKYCSRNYGNFPNEISWAIYLQLRLLFASPRLEIHPSECWMRGLFILMGLIIALEFQFFFRSIVQWIGRCLIDAETADAAGYLIIIIYAMHTNGFARIESTPSTVSI